METYEVQKSYAQWLGQTDADLVITLNTERELVDTILLSSFDQLSAVLRKYFYKIECDVFGYLKREKYKTKCRVNRVVCIERDNKRTHAHILVKTLEGWTNAEMIELLNLSWHDLQRTRNKSFTFKAQHITTQNKLSMYNTKETRRQNEQLNDVLDLRSSFISKHSNKQ